MSLVTANGLNIGYGSMSIARGLELDLGAGEVVALIGPNGVGKTTLLLTLSGLLPPISGQIMVFNKPVEPTRRAHRMVKQGLSHVPEDRSLFGGLTVAQHLRIPGRLDYALEVRIFELFPALGAIRGRRAKLLSGGEQQMLAIARALACRPRALLVDELSLGLAPPVVNELLSVLRKLAESEGLGILIVEQNIDLALAVSDRAYVMGHGVISPSVSAVDLRSSRELLEEAFLGGQEQLL
jgi:branched-chain amino acid transport system ATP-binding protein